MIKKDRCFIIGAGPSGCTLANKLSNYFNKIIIYDKRNNISGNCYDKKIEGILTHIYGPHFFHTSNDDVFNFLSKYTDWLPYELKVKAKLENDEIYDLPINRNTLNKFFNRDFKTDEETNEFIEGIRLDSIEIKDAESQVLNKVGEDIYLSFFKGYTQKQWNRHPKELDASITARIPIRTNTDDRYFTDKYQALPKDGYTKMFERMIDKNNIDVRLGYEVINLFSFMQEIKFDESKDVIISSMPIDNFLGNAFGELEYRSLDIKIDVLKGIDKFQENVIINYPSIEKKYTRKVETKHIYNNNKNSTVVITEYPKDKGEKYYPILTPKNKEKLEQYKNISNALEKINIYTIGRLGLFKYLNIDQTIEEALNLSKKIINKIDEE